MRFAADGLKSCSAGAAKLVERLLGPVGSLSNQADAACRGRPSVLAYVLFCLPWLSFLYSLLAWLIFGVDMPNYDDWRSLDSRQLGTFSMQRLMEAANGTLAPVGYLLDELAQLLLNGNAVAYQFLSFGLVMGSLLTLQWKLLHWMLKDFTLAAACFSLTLLMVQPGTYWGAQNMAYHQALPLVFLMGILRELFCSERRGALTQPLVALLALLGAFSYISGAFAMLTAGIVLWGFGIYLRTRDASLIWMSHGRNLTVIGGLAAFCHVYWALWPRNGVDPHPVPKAWPFQGEFWWFLLGKVGRALLLPMEWPTISIVVTLGAVLFVLLLIVLTLRRAWCDKPETFDECGGVVVPLVLLAVVLVYLMIVAAGRTHWRPANVTTPQQVFAFGMLRFHFFWVTILGPWCLVMVCRLLASRREVVPQIILRGIPVGAAVAATVMCLTGVLNHGDFFRSETQDRLDLRACLEQHLQVGEPLQCPQVDFIPDLTVAYIYARSIKASFVRTVSVLPVLSGTAPSDMWLRFDRKFGDPPTPGTFHWSVDKPAHRCRMLEVELLFSPMTSMESLTFVYLDRAKDSMQRPGTAHETMVKIPPSGQNREVRTLLDTNLGFTRSLSLKASDPNVMDKLLKLTARCRVVMPDG